MIPWHPWGLVTSSAQVSWSRWPWLWRRSFGQRIAPAALESQGANLIHPTGCRENWRKKERANICKYDKMIQTKCIEVLVDIQSSIFWMLQQHILYIILVDSISECSTIPACTWRHETLLSVASRISDLSAILLIDPKWARCMMFCSFACFAIRFCTYSHRFLAGDAGESCVAFHGSDRCWRLQALMQLDLPQALLLCRTGSWGDIKWDASVKTIESWQTAKLKPICKNNWVLISAMLNRNFAYSSLWDSMMQDTAPFNV